MPENIEITSEVDRRNPEICRFTSERTLYVGTKTVTSMDEAKGFPLAERLVCIPGISKIQLIGHLLVATKSSDRAWSEVSKEVEAVLTAYLISGLALTPEDVHDRMMLIGRTAREKVQYLIDTEINPGVAEHGGSVQVVDVNETSVYLRLHVAARDVVPRISRSSKVSNRSSNDQCLRLKVLSTLLIIAQGLVRTIDGRASSSLVSKGSSFLSPV
jgi:hypothetical protein